MAATTLHSEDHRGLDVAPMSGTLQIVFLRGEMAYRLIHPCLRPHARAQRSADRL